MNLDLNEQQQLLKDMFEKLFREQSTPARVRAAAPLGFDRELWAALVALGAPLARAPETAGGLGFTLHDAAIIAEEAGRHLASVPLIEVMVSARLLAEAGDGGREWVDRIGAGEAIVVIAVNHVRGGIAQIVPGGAVSDAVIALDGEELVLIASAPSNASPPNIAELPIAKMILAGTGIIGTRTVLARGADAKRAYCVALEEWRILSAASLAGLAHQALKLAAAYANDRVQFGRPIGSFQGLAHPLADAITDVEAGQLMVWKAIWAIATGEEDAAALATLAWWWIGQSTVTAVRRATRALGGYGLSLEYDLQLYNRRGNSLVLLGGDPAKMLALAGDRLYGADQPALPDAGDISISFALGEKAKAFGMRMSDFFAENQTQEMRDKAHHSTSSHDRQFHRQLAQEGLIFGEWPNEYGGTGVTSAEAYAGADQFELWDYTTHVLGTSDLVAQMVMKFGTDAAKAEVIPRIKSGDAVCSLGFSEPASGSDVFAARTAAVRTGDDWIINGQKMFTTAGHYADYVILLARTDSSETKHKGLTLFIVPTTLPGFSFQAVYTYQDERTNITYFSDLRLPDRYRLGEVDKGSSVMATALSMEHGGGSLFHGQQRMMKYAMEWARTSVDGKAPIDDLCVRSRMAVVKARYEASHCFVARGLWADNTGRFSRAWGPMSKMFISDTYMRSCWDILEMAGSESILTGKHPLGFVELGHRRSYGMTIYGGTSEIHRSLVAEQALGLPKSRS